MAICIFILTVAAIVIISSVGMTTINLPALPNQIATVRKVVASAPFTYLSQERTHSARDQLVQRVPPVYRLEFDTLHRFEAAARDLLARLAVFEAAHPATGPAYLTATAVALANVTDQFNASAPYRVSEEDLAALLSAGNAAARSTLFENGLAALREIYAEGVHDASFAGASSDNVIVFQIIRPGGEIALRPVESMEDALAFLRVSLTSEGAAQPAVQALFRFFRNGVVPNLVYDRAATEARVTEALRALRPVMVTVPAGQVIVEAGERVSREQYEMFRAHQDFVREHGDAGRMQGLLLFGHVLLVLAMVLASLIYIRLEDPETLRSNVRLGLLACVVIANLALVRVVYSVGGADFSSPATLPGRPPCPILPRPALATLIVAILIDAGSGIFIERCSSPSSPA